MEKADLFVAQSETESVEVRPGLVVTVRGLSAYEIELCTKLSDQGPGAMNRRLLELAFVEPSLTAAEVDQFKAAARFDQYQRVVDTVNRLSGLGKYAQKEAYKSDGAGSDDRVSDLPGTEAGPDGGRADADDQP